jgi:patatin-like phospholipase/acyl hydrolase
MSPYQVLSLDGGGIRGIVTLVLMQRLSAEPGLEGWMDSADLLAGTSTGGLIALGLARGIPLEELRELYETKGSTIFDDSWLDDLKDLGKIAGADYDLKGLRRELRRIFGGTTLGQLRRKVLITSFDLDNEDPDPSRRTWKPKLFHNFPGRDSDGEELCWKVALRTSAAPTYFPSFEGYVDGAVYAANPSMCGLAQALDARARRPAALEDVVVLSLGTGRSLTWVKGQSVDWGHAQWVRPLVTLMLDGVSGIADFQCRQILGSRYHRLDPAFPPDRTYKLDEWRKVPEMIEFAEQVDIAPTARFLRKAWLGQR